MLRQETLLAGDESFAVKILQNDEGHQISIGDQIVQIDDVSCQGDQMSFTHDGVTRTVAFSLFEDQISLDLGERVANIVRTTYQPVLAADAAGSGQVKAATEGLVVDILVGVGDEVSMGDTLVVVEAMKMEHRHLADGDGKVTSIHVEKDQQVKNRQLLVELDLVEAEDESA